MLRQVNNLLPYCRVLIPSDVRNWVVNLAEAYHLIGFEVAAGACNFELECSNPDVVHFQWPEELTSWKIPTNQQIDAIESRLDRWATRARLMATVHNLYPHREQGNPQWRRLFTAVYKRADVIHHFGQTSKTLVCQEFPEIADRNHVVRLGFNYDRLLPSTRRDRAASRQALGIAPDEIVYLVFGSLRSWHEVRLIQQAFSQAQVRGKRLLMAARYNEPGPVWRQRCRRWQWKLWQRLNLVRCITDYVPDEEVYQLFDAADAVVIVRQNSMGSGIPSLTMTFGRMAIAPNAGMIPEYLAGADNLLYDGDSASSLALAMERAATLDRESIGARNREIAANWGWEGIIRACVDAIPARRPDWSLQVAQN
jgi:glycosyltransferase involved in cell wall biosynthesis